LLEHTKLLLYTPANEHFGIVPVEAMHMGCIVLACNSGGPLESIVDGETGFLMEQDANTWGNKITEILNNSFIDNVARMQNKAKSRVLKMFVIEAFASNLD